VPLAERPIELRPAMQPATVIAAMREYSSAVCRLMNRAINRDVRSNAMRSPQSRA
jgi:hypothetical protein